MDILANGIRLQYIESGSGYPVICMHGNGLNRDLWRYLTPELNKKYRAIVYELRGMGKSETPGKPGATITNEDHAKDLKGLMDALNIKEAAIVAHAFGAFVSMRFAIDYAERVSAMVVVGTSAKLGGKTREGIPKWIEITEKEGVEPLLDETMERWFVESFRREHPEVIKLYRDMFAANPPMGYAANYRGILQYDLIPELHKIKCPTLVVSGAEDESTPTGDHEIIVKKIPNSKLVIVPKTSHTVPEEEVEGFNRMTLEFLNQNIPEGREYRIQDR